MRAVQFVWETTFPPVRAGKSLQRYLSIPPVLLSMLSTRELRFVLDRKSMTQNQKVCSSHWFTCSSRNVFPYDLLTNDRDGNQFALPDWQSSFCLRETS